jgi:hypothetical protein
LRGRIIPQGATRFTPRRGRPRRNPRPNTRSLTDRDEFSGATFSIVRRHSRKCRRDYGAEQCERWHHAIRPEVETEAAAGHEKKAFLGVPGLTMCRHDLPAMRRIALIVKPGSPGKGVPEHFSRLRSRPPLARAAWSQSFRFPSYDHAARATLGLRRRTRRPGLRVCLSASSVRARIRVLSRESVGAMLRRMRRPRGSTLRRPAVLGAR